MLDRFLSLIAPYACVSCARSGPIMCSGCVHDLMESREDFCIGCGRPTSATGICVACRPDLPFDAARVVARRDGLVEELINAFKFARARETYRPLADMLAPLLPKGPGCVVVPVPTIRRHVRQRGYDHAALIARRVARLNGNGYAPLISRRTRTVQHGANKATRLRQVENAFFVPRAIDPSVTYIVLDDITTTGASLIACARVLRAAGATIIFAAAIARQPLDGLKKS